MPRFTTGCRSGLQAVLAAAVTFEQGAAPQELESVRGASSSYCAPEDDRRRIDLPDGDNAVLRSGTCINVIYLARQRLVKLDSGEALFTVMHDPDKPFVVETGRVTIANIGTRFDVYTREEFGTRVAVFEGAISIAPRGMTNPRAATPLTAGQQLDIPSDASRLSQLTHITPDEIERMTA